MLNEIWQQITVWFALAWVQKLCRIGDLSGPDLRGVSVSFEENWQLRIIQEKNSSEKTNSRLQGLRGKRKYD